MEGFEYKNYTSKQVLNNRTNGKIHTNIVLQSMQVLQLLYDCTYFDPVAEKKQNLQQSKMITKYKQMVDNNNKEATNTTFVAI